MMDSVTKPYDQCIQFLVDNIDLDPHFTAFLDYAIAHNIPVVVLSGGMEPIIKALLAHLVGERAEKIEIVSNHVGLRSGHGSINEEGGWELVFHDDSRFGHDKSLAIRPYAELPADQRPTLFYAGDGVSDLSAARETDLLFAKTGRDLVSYCVREDVPFTLFEDWSDILQKVRDIVEVKIDVSEAAAEGYAAYKKSAKVQGLVDQAKRSGHTTPLVPEAGGGAKALLRR
jgi:2,3-diketo-5-methylthio-1-phosphopentane phosphatase